MEADASTGGTQCQPAALPTPTGRVLQQLGRQSQFQGVGGYEKRPGSAVLSSTGSLGEGGGSGWGRARGGIGAYHAMAADIAADAEAMGAGPGAEHLACAPLHGGVPQLQAALAGWEAVLGEQQQPALSAAASVAAAPSGRTSALGAATTQHPRNHKLTALVEGDAAVTNRALASAGVTAGTQDIAQAEAQPSLVQQQKLQLTCLASRDAAASVGLQDQLQATPSMVGSGTLTGGTHAPSNGDEAAPHFLATTTAAAARAMVMPMAVAQQRPVEWAVAAMGTAGLLCAGRAGTGGEGDHGRQPPPPTLTALSPPVMLTTASARLLREFTAADAAAEAATGAMSVGLGTSGGDGGGGTSWDAVKLSGGEQLPRGSGANVFVATGDAAGVTPVVTLAPNSVPAGATVARSATVSGSEASTADARNTSGSGNGRGSSRLAAMSLAGARTSQLAPAPPLARPSSSLSPVPRLDLTSLVPSPSQLSAVGLVRASSHAGIAALSTRLGGESFALHAQGLLSTQASATHASPRHTPRKLLGFSAHARGSLLGGGGGGSSPTGTGSAG
jgi:hypothetical protein